MNALTKAARARAGRVRPPQSPAQVPQPLSHWAELALAIGVGFVIGWALPDLAAWVASWSTP